VKLGIRIVLFQSSPNPKVGRNVTSCCPWRIRNLFQSSPNPKVGRNTLGVFKPWTLFLSSNPRPTRSGDQAALRF
jgi:hypothetical protein